MALLTISLSDEEKELIREEAEMDRRTMSTLVLHVVIPHLRELKRLREARRAAAVHATETEAADAV